MKTDMLTIIRKEFARFFKDRSLVITTILLPGFLIFLIYSFMGDGMMKEFSTDENYVAKAYVQNMPAELSPAFEQLSAEWTVVSSSEIEDTKALIQNKEADVLVVFPEDFIAKVSAYDVKSGEIAPNVEIYYNSTEAESANLRSILVDILDQYEASMANKFDINAGDGVFNLASEKDMTGQIFAMMLPMLLMTFMFSGCMSVAPESIAGEKERGTIATLLVTPMKRSALALGKVISLSCIALLSGLSSFIGTMLSMPKLMGTEEGVSAAVYVVTDYVMLLGIILTTVLVMVALIAIISALAKSIKAASTAVSPLMIIVMVISLMPMFGGDGEKSLAMFFVPLYNSVLCIHGIFSFTYQPIQIVITIVMNLVYAGALSWVLTRLFNNENVMFSK
ncbi:MAG: ABC transporter permease subunit [Lachnospiraceae bacterium]|nr:ABC transporter permease subunit [Lachnospiraceae bacterium]